MSFLLYYPNVYIPLPSPSLMPLVKPKKKGPSIKSKKSVSFSKFVTVKSVY